MAEGRSEEEATIDDANAVAAAATADDPLLPPLTPPPLAGVASGCGTFVSIADAGVVITTAADEDPLCGSAPPPPAAGAGEGRVASTLSVRIGGGGEVRCETGGGPEGDGKTVCGCPAEAATVREGAVAAGLIASGASTDGTKPPKPASTLFIRPTRPPLPLLLSLMAL